MRRTARVTGTLCAVLGLGWTGLWFAGSYAADEGLVRALDDAAAAGMDVSLGARRFTGFPFALRAELADLALRDPSSGAELHFPRLTGGVAVDDPTAVVTRLPNQFTMRLPVAGRMVPIEVEAEDAVLRATGFADPAPRLEIRAARLLFVHAEAADAPALALEMIGAEGTLTAPAPDGSGAAKGQLRLDRLDWAGQSGRPALVAEGNLDGVALTFGAKPASPGAATELDLAVTAVRGRGRVVPPAESAPRRIDWEVTTLSATLEFANARARAGLASERTRVSLPAADGPATALIADAAEARADLPLNTEHAPAPVAASIRLARLDGDAAFWSAADPDDVLPREPLGISLDLSGDVRPQAPGAPRTRLPGTAMSLPFAIGTLRLDGAEISGLGARATASGVLDLASGNPPQEGRLGVAVEGAGALLGALRRTQLVPLELVQAAGLALFYFERSAVPGRLTTELRLDGGRLFLNGKPIR
ncbi:MAG: DUF2125 domain-containing protein [Paracoccaceae bacterium]